MGKNQNSVVVLWIWLKFWCMIPMGVKYNHTTFDFAKTRSKHANMRQNTHVSCGTSRQCAASSSAQV